MSVTAIQSEVLNLPAQDRARLLDLIWESLNEPEIKAREAAGATEAERRIDAYDSGKLTARDAADVFCGPQKIVAEVKARFTSVAERELREAMEFYETAQPGLGREFPIEVEAAAGLIVAHPQAWAGTFPAHAALTAASLSFRPVLPDPRARNPDRLGDGSAPETPSGGSIIFSC